MNEERRNELQQRLNERLKAARNDPTAVEWAAKEADRLVQITTARDDRVDAIAYAAYQAMSDIYLNGFSEHEFIAQLSDLGYEVRHSGE